MVEENKDSHLVRYCAGFFGLGLIALLLWRIGLDEVAKHIVRIGWLAPLVLFPQALVALFDAKGWDYTFSLSGSRRPFSLLRLSLIRLAGEAVNNLTPTANVGGEAIKVYLLRKYGVPSEVGTASVVAAKTALTISQVAFIVLGLPFFLFRFEIGYHAWWILGVVLTVAYSFIRLIIRWQKRGLGENTVDWLQRRFPKWRRLDVWRLRAKSVDAHLLTLYEREAGDFTTACMLHFLGWLAGAVEVYVFMVLIGAEASWTNALIIETMIQPVTAAALIIPGALGVREAAGVFLCRLLGIGDGVGLTLMVLKRAREAVYNLIGLLVLTRAGYRPDRPEEPGL